MNGDVDSTSGMTTTYDHSLNKSSGTDHVDNTTAFNVDAYLVERLGERYRSLLESVILTILYAIILLTGIIGNVTTCAVIIRNNYMHTVTNYYLFSLAISDVFTLILGLPPEMYTIWEAYPWRFGEAYCLFKTFLTEMTSSASALTITAFTVERYIAICHPLRAQTLSSLSRAVRILALIWIIACLSALPYPLHTRSFYFVVDPDEQLIIEESLVCNIPEHWRPAMAYIFQFSTFLLFVFPMILITILYLLIGLSLRRSALVRQTSSTIRTSIGPAGTRTQSRKSIIKMLVAVVVAFFVCCAPFHAQRLMMIYVPQEYLTGTFLEFQSMLFYVSGILYFVISTLNPILYNLMSKKYREAFKSTLCPCCTTPQRPRHCRHPATRNFKRLDQMQVSKSDAGGKRVSIEESAFSELCRNCGTLKIRNAVCKMTSSEDKLPTIRAADATCTSQPTGTTTHNNALTVMHDNTPAQRHGTVVVNLNKQCRCRRSISANSLQHYNVIKQASHYSNGYDV